MNCLKSLSLMLGLTLVVLFLVGCGSGSQAMQALLTPESEAMPIPLSPTSTPIPVLPAATPTPVPSTATPSLAVGSMQGALVESGSNQPIADAYILLCAVVDPAASEPECLLDADLAAVAGADGKFELENVPVGTYVVVYGLSDEAQGSPQTWDGRSVRYRAPATDSAGMATDPFGGTKGVILTGGTTITFAADGFIIDTGSFMSAEFGLSIEYREREPLTVSVIAGQTAQITVDVTGRSTATSIATPEPAATSESETDQTTTAAPAVPLTIPTISIPTITIPTITIPTLVIPKLVVPTFAIPARVIPIATPTPAPAAVVTANTLNLRAGPGTDHDIKGRVRRGDNLQILGQHGTCAWLEVVTPQKLIGWVSGRYVKLDVPCNSIPDTTSRPLTGTILRDSERSGLGELTVENGTEQDGVVVLARLDNTPVTAFYVRSKGSFTLKGIRDGTYRLLFTMGKEWNRDGARFTTDSFFQRFEDTFTFITTATATGRQYSIWQVTLHPVAGGTAGTELLSPDQFPDLK